MTTKIGILRGINVGGKRKILMTDLKSLCENLGWKNVETYIQSGNLIFDSNQLNPELETNLQQAIQNAFGFDVPVIVREAEEFQSIIARNPFLGKNPDIGQLHMTFLKETPMDEHLEKTLSYNFEPDEFKIDGQNVFLFCSGKYHQSKLTNNFFEKKLKVGATTRNWKTILKLAELTKR